MQLLLNAKTTHMPRCRVKTYLRHKRGVSRRTRKPNTKLMNRRCTHRQASADRTRAVPTEESHVLLSITVDALVAWAVSCTNWCSTLPPS